MLVLTEKGTPLSTQAHPLTTHALWAPLPLFSLLKVRVNFLVGEHNTSRFSGSSVIKAVPAEHITREPGAWRVGEANSCLVDGLTQVTQPLFYWRLVAALKIQWRLFYFI